jgi:hypothetical protein
MRIQLASYKAEYGNNVDKIIAWWTDSEYSHTEIIVDGVWYSTSPRDLRLRAKRIAPTEGHWDIVDISDGAKDCEVILAEFAKYEGAKYDWTGIALSQVLPLGMDSEQRWFCSEWAAHCLQSIGKLGTAKEANEYNPGSLHKVVSR